MTDYRLTFEVEVCTPGDDFPDGVVPRRLSEWDTDLLEALTNAANEYVHGLLQSGDDLRPVEVEVVVE